jgi:hypothetical protein
MLIEDLGAEEGGLHPVAEEIEDGWLHEWIGRGLAELESYLAKHAAFLRYLDTFGRD